MAHNEGAGLLEGPILYGHGGGFNAVGSDQLVCCAFIAVQKILGEEFKWEDVAGGLDSDRVGVFACAAYFGAVGARGSRFDSIQGWAASIVLSAVC